MRLEKADAFREDFALQALWYVRQAGDDVARRFQQAVDSTLRLLCEQPGIGRERQFRHLKLQGLHSFAVERPFQRLVIFYRADGETLQAVRLMYGARDLRRRLAEPPGSETRHASAQAMSARHVEVLRSGTERAPAVSGGGNLAWRGGGFVSRWSH